jgi:IPT/TIG domain
MAALVALIASALAVAVAPPADAKKKKRAPVITSVSPKDVAVGETLTIRGRNFISGRNRNTVVFKRDGARAVFVKAELGTKKMLTLKVPDSLQEFFSLNAGEPIPTRFRLRVLAKKLGKQFTGDKISPVVSAPRPARADKPDQATPDGDCDGDGDKNKVDGDDDNDGLADGTELSLSLDPCVADTDEDGLLDKWEFDCDRNGVLNRDEDDDDKDLLADGTETMISTNPCALDSDGDGVEDGFEYQSAKDLNDDEYQEPNAVLPYPGKRPYPNPLYADASVDYDGDSLRLADEQMLWKYSYQGSFTATRTLETLSYSDGMQHSLFSYVSGANRRRVPSQPFSTYPMQQRFLDWTVANGYRNVYVSTSRTFAAPVGAVNGFYEIRDVNLDGTVDPSEASPADYDGNGWVGDAERDEDADGLSNYEEVSGTMRSEYWTGCYSNEGSFPIVYAGTSATDPDSDGDNVLDGADDQDHDDVPNLMELSRIEASGEDDREGGQVCKIDDALKQAAAANPDDQFLNHPNEYGRVNPYNPCLPFTDARTCPRFHEIGGSGYAPFDLSEDWFALQ